jgi:hypothetical protein
MTNEQATETEAGTYEPPQVEAVLTTEDLAREIHYAGIDSGPQPPG